MSLLRDFESEEWAFYPTIMHGDPRSLLIFPILRDRGSPFVIVCSLSRQEGSVRCLFFTGG